MRANNRNDFVEILEVYLQSHFSRESLKIELGSELVRFGFVKSEITRIEEDILEEIDKETMARMSAGKARTKVFVGVVLTIISGVFVVLASMGILFQRSVISVFSFSLVFSGLFAFIKGLDELKDRKRRAEMRKLIWQMKYNKG